MRRQEGLELAVGFHWIISHYISEDRVLQIGPFISIKYSKWVSIPRALLCVFEVNGPNSILHSIAVILHLFIIFIAVIIFR